MLISGKGASVPRFGLTDSQAASRGKGSYGSLGGDNFHLIAFRATSIGQVRLSPGFEEPIDVNAEIREAAARARSIPRFVSLQMVPGVSCTRRSCHTSPSPSMSPSCTSRR